MINDDTDRRCAQQRGQREYKTLLDGVRQKAAKQGRALSYNDAQQEAKQLYWQRKTKPDQVLPANDALETRLIEALADVLERSKAERIASAIVEIVQAHSVQKTEYPPMLKATAVSEEDRLDRLIDIKQFAELLQMSTRGLWRLSKVDPDFPKEIRISKRVRWRLRDVHAWIKQHGEAA